LKAYLLYIHDRRYGTPTLDVITAASDQRACELARGRLNASCHYSAVELWEDERFVCRIQK